MNRTVLVSLLLLAAACTGGDDAPADDAPPDDGEILVTPVGTPIGPVTTVEIGPEGGRAATPDGGIAVDVPPGAVAAPTAFTIQPITGGDAAYRLGPDGQTFAVPVTLTFGHAAERAGEDLASVIVAYQTASGGWNQVRTSATDPAAHTISVQTTHFTDWLRRARLDVSPATSTVPTGGTETLGAQLCHSDHPDCDLDMAESLGCPVRCYNLTNYDVEWAVDGVVGGTPEKGTITTGNGMARYAAPVHAPDPDTVQVSARCQTDCASTGAAIAFASIKIEDKPLYVGYVNATSNVNDAGGVWTTTSTTTVVFAYDVTDSYYHPREGTVHSTIDINAAGCQTHVVHDGGLAWGDGLLGIQGTAYVYAGMKNATSYTGSTTCDSGTFPAMFTGILTWWPNDTASGTSPLDEEGIVTGAVSFTDPTGAFITADWRLEPIDPDDLE